MAVAEDNMKESRGPVRAGRLGSVWRRFFYSGKARYCPCCQSEVRCFKPYGVEVSRPEARCPVCLSLERHRLIYLYLSEETNLFNPGPKKMLHVAPERHLSRLFQWCPQIDYLSADLDSPTAMVNMDITNIQYPDDSFDVIYCSHVLEHVPDDRKAMREFYRVLRPGGWAILQVPITAKETYEDPSITSPKERLRHFGQFDHVRRYGPDYVDRLREAGFSVTADMYGDDFEPELVRRYGLVAERIYMCRKVQAE